MSDNSESRTDRSAVRRHRDIYSQSVDRIALRGKRTGAIAVEYEVESLLKANVHLVVRLPVVGSPELVLLCEALLDVHDVAVVLRDVRLRPALIARMNANSFTPVLPCAMSVPFALRADGADLDNQRSFAELPEPVKGDACRFRAAAERAGVESVGDGDGRLELLLPQRRGVARLRLAERRDLRVGAPDDGAVSVELGPGRVPRRRAVERLCDVVCAADPASVIAGTQFTPRVATHANPRRDGP